MRRTILRGTAAAVGLGVVGGVGVWRGSRPALAVEMRENNWSADDAEITTHDGTITAVTVQPTVVFEWRGFNEDETEVTLEIAVDFPDAEADDGGLISGVLGLLVDTEDLPLVVYNETKTLTGTNGSEEFALDENDLTAEEEINEEGFGAENGETNETRVELELTAIPDTDDIEDVTVSDEFTVTVENLASSAEIGGTVETGVESDEEVEDTAT